MPASISSRKGRQFGLKQLGHLDEDDLEHALYPGESILPVEDGEGRRGGA